MKDVENFISHVGVKGMKWGIRKDTELVFSKELKNGERLDVYRQPTPPIARLMSKYSETARQSNSSSMGFDLKNKEGKVVGYVDIQKKSSSELYLNWINVKSKEQGKGYASAALKGVVEYAKKDGFKKLKLEVPYVSPDARHIYEKVGFKVTKEEIDPEDPVWGGLTTMEYDIDYIKQSDIWEEDFSIEFAEAIAEAFDKIGSLTMNDNDVENFIAHFGVKGMKWGVRKRTRSSENVEVRSLRRKSAKELSDSDLKKAISRMQLEKQYKDLNPKGISLANKLVLGVLALGTTANSVVAFRNSPTGKAIANAVKSKFNG